MTGVLRIEGVVAFGDDADKCEHILKPVRSPIVTPTKWGYWRCENCTYVMVVRVKPDDD